MSGIPVDDCNDPFAMPSDPGRSTQRLAHHCYGGMNASDARGVRGHNCRMSSTTPQQHGSVNLGKWEVPPDDKVADIGFGFFGQDGDDRANTDRATPQQPDCRDVNTDESPWSPSLLAG